MTFYRSHGNYCAETTLKSALSLRGIDKKISEIIFRTRHEKGKGLWPVELASALIDLEVSFKYPVKENFTNISSQQKLEQNILNYYGQEDGTRIIQESNLPNILKSRERILNNGFFQLKGEQNRNLEGAIEDKKLVLVLINSDKYFKRQDNNHGHYLLITGQDNTRFSYYDCGPKSFKIDGKIPKKRIYEFSKGFSLLDWGIILI